MNTNGKPYLGPRRDNYSVLARQNRPERDCAISKDEIVDLKIELHNVKTVEDLLRLPAFV